jgi:hypothetical protein
MHIAEFRLLIAARRKGAHKKGELKMKASLAMLMKTNVEKMSVYRSLAILMKTIELKSLSRDVDEKQGSWLKPGG